LAANAKEKKQAKSVRLKESTITRLEQEADARDIGEGVIVEKGLALLFDKWDLAPTLSPPGVD
jgi:hypothetical protein